MKLNLVKVADAVEALEKLKDEKIPFRASMILARNLNTLKKTRDFLVEQEQRFALEYLEVDEETGRLIQTEPGVFKIKEGKVEECSEARKALDEYEEEVEIKMIKASELEKIDFAPADLAAIEFMIDFEDAAE